MAMAVSAGLHTRMPRPGMCPLCAAGQEQRPLRRFQLGELALPSFVAGALGSVGWRKRSVRYDRKGQVVVQATASSGFSPEQRSLLKKESKKRKEMEAQMLERGMLELFDKMEEPDIYKVREILMRLAKLSSKPNQKLAGDWIIFWASREGCVDRLFGSGATDEGWYMQLNEYMLRFSPAKKGRVVEAAEIIRKVGPFPDRSYRMKGKYSIQGINGLKIEFTELREPDGKEMKARGGKDKLVVDCDVLYSSKTMIAMQWEDSNGECDFYVLTPVEEGIDAKADEFTGVSKARTFFN
eukprot:TRINITY_DN73832_c0_g1_i1.p1 TRINITY_DN73832_c0_g1~~TRINITY_DN73832_c0_g1_i1.p1  ORF type:complete len:296 (-),score=52.59 TRINITY_DN73832_c0_g1_i1:205-1092(-)